MCDIIIRDENIIIAFLIIALLLIVLYFVEKSYKDEYYRIGRNDDIDKILKDAKDIKNETRAKNDVQFTYIDDTDRKWNPVDKEGGYDEV